ncbi:glycosyltransferase [Pseudoalteromonas undina]|uniref:Glycosyltransferase n=1 Tax=Pseudoalteromonas undina TaxID=43660 RepID=A0ACC6R939_9GAMM
MKKILFATHENLELTAVSKAMFLDVADYLESELNYKTIIFSAAENKKITGRHFKFERKTQGKIDFQSILASIKAFFVFRQALKDVDLVVFRSYPSMALFSLIVKLKKKKIVFDTRGLFFDELVDSGKVSLRWSKFFDFIERNLLKISSTIICVTNYQKSHYVEKYKLDPNNFLVIPNGAKKVPVHDDKSNNEDAISLCYLGSLVKWHAPELVCGFCVELEKRDIKFKLDVITKDTNGAHKYFSRLQSVKIYSHDYRNRPIRFDYGFCFIQGGVSKDVCYPVKFNEYVASGTKVLALDNVLEVNKIIRKYDLGIVLKGKNIKEIVDQFLLSLRTTNTELNPLPYELTFDFQLSQYASVLENIFKDKVCSGTY